MTSDIWQRKTYASWRKDGLRWYQTPEMNVRTGDGFAGLTMHRLIDNELDHFPKKTVAERIKRIPTLVTHVKTLRDFCIAYLLPEEHIQKTLVEINEWLPKHEISMKEIR